MNFDLNSALEQGIELSVSREKSVEEIDNLLHEVDMAVQGITDGKAELKWRLKRYNVIGAFAQLAIPMTDVKIESQEPEHRVLFLISTVDPEIKYDLTVLTIGSDGYPCEMNVNGNKLISYDINSLTDHVRALLSSTFVGDKVRRLRNQGA